MDRMQISNDELLALLEHSREDRVELPIVFSGSNIYLIIKMMRPETFSKLADLRGISDKA